MKIIDIDGKEAGSKKLPIQFSEPINPDIIKRAVLAIRSHNIHPRGADPMAGEKSVAKLSRRRRDYKSSYGHGISRAPRKIISRRGMRINWIGAFAPGTRGGRRAHPPKASKIWGQKINTKENRKAIRSALAASLTKDVVIARGHKIPDNYPFFISNNFESLKKTGEVIKALVILGLTAELERSSKKNVRAGRGKMRGRKYQRAKGPLIVVSDKCDLLKSARNISGVDIVSVKSVNSELLAPGTVPGRLTLFTAASIDRLEKEKLFM